MTDDKSAVERLASAWEHQDRYFPSGPQYAVDLRAAIEEDRAAGQAYTDLAAEAVKRAVLAEAEVERLRKTLRGTAEGDAIDYLEAENARLCTKVARAEKLADKVERRGYENGAAYFGADVAKAIRAALADEGGDDA